VTAARSAILARVRDALADVPAAPPVASAASLAGRAGDECERFVARVSDYGATVVVTERPADAVATALARHGARRIGVAPDLDRALVPPEVDAVVDHRLSATALDALDGALTTCAWACAETGTIALTGGTGEGRRALSLVPDLHVCVVRGDQIVGTVPELLARLKASALEGRPIVLVSGPSATSDIELTRVEGVHGPRRLEVVVIASTATEA
jgi:L-lactate dehydrogenase complex protein LldG